MDACLCLSGSINATAWARRDERKRIHRLVYKNLCAEKNRVAILPRNFCRLHNLNRRATLRQHCMRTDEIIQRNVGSFTTRPYANWVKSLAYLNRSRLKTELNDSWFNDMAAAAELGNLQAAKNISDSLISWIAEKNKIQNIKT